MRILGIETSCDDTGVALYDTATGGLTHRLWSQTQLHAEYGGVVPELASRDHVRSLLPLTQMVLAEARVTRADGVAYTAGPGLVGALLVGAAFGESLAYAWGVPVLGVHHLEGHLLAPMLDRDPPEFPFVALLVSGGHTLLMDVLGIGQYRLLGESLDDAAGEAFDKTAKLLGLGYPGGPAIEALATEGHAGRYRFSRPLLDRPNLDFSFSGLKTQALLAIKAARPLDRQTQADLAREFQAAAIEVLVAKAARAVRLCGHNRLVAAGGVTANRQLRAHLTEAGRVDGFQVFYPRPEFCTDNGAMIAYAGSQRISQRTHVAGFEVRARWPLSELSPP